MGTSILECGCSFTINMFGDNEEILNISPCMKHVVDNEIQQKMKELSNLIVKKVKK